MLDRTRLNLVLRQNLMLVILIILFGVMALSVPAFTSMDNLSTLLLSSSMLGIMVCGMLFVLLAGGIDVALTTEFAFAGYVFARLFMVEHVPPQICIVVVLLATAAIGVINGIVVTKFRINPFIATLGIAFILHAVNTYVTWAGSSSGIYIKWFSFIGHGDLYGIPVPAIILLVVALIGHFVLTRSTLGRHIYAAGGNEAAARMSGVNIDRTRIITYIVCSILAAVAGLISVSIFEAASQSGTREGPLGAALMEVFAGLFIGGASLYGGVGTIRGVITGLMIIRVLMNGLTIAGVDPQSQMVVKGIILVLAISLDRLLNSVWRVKVKPVSKAT